MDYYLSFLLSKDDPKALEHIMVLDEQQLVRNHLRQYYFDAQERNPRFSMRAFATKIGISSSALSEILRGKRRISKTKALAYADIIGISKKQKQILTEAFDKTGSLEKLKPSPSPLSEVVLDSSMFHIMADRKYFSVLAMFRSKNNSPSTMAKKLGFKTAEVTNMMDELVKIGVLENINGEYIEKERKVFRTSEDFPLDLIQKRRLQNNEASRFAIKNNLEGERGYFATVSIDKEKLNEIEPIVEDFIKRLSYFLMKPGSEDVFEVNLDIFPWTR
jgi:uncharacterized protein (TIGR02147 family)